MRNAIVLAGFLILVLGVFFARDRLKRAFQIGAVLYAISIVVRFVIFGVGDRDGLMDVLTLLAVFFLVWLIARAIVDAIIERRKRSGRPPA